MEKIVDNQDKNHNEATNQTDVKSAFISLHKRELNINAKPFDPLLPAVGKQKSRSDEILKLKIPLNGEIWKCISAEASRDFHGTKTPVKTTFNRSFKIQTIMRPLLCKSLTLNVCPNGLIHIFRTDNIHIQISLNRAIHVSCADQNIQIGVSNSTTLATIIHPNGRINQNDSHTDVVAFDGHFRRMAKLWFKGITFTAENIPIVYLLDEAGLRTTNDRFFDIKKNFAIKAFSKRMLCGPGKFDEAADVMKTSIHSQCTDGTEIIEINQFRITSNTNGVIHIQGPNNKCTMRIDPRKAGLSLTTLNMHCSASLGAASHLFLRQCDRRIHFDGNLFCVRNAGHSAALDERNKLIILNKDSMAVKHL